MNFRNPAKEDLEGSANAALVVLFGLAESARAGCGVILIGGDHRHAERCSRAAFLPPAEGVQEERIVTLVDSVWDEAAIPRSRSKRGGVFGVR